MFRMNALFCLPVCYEQEYYLIENITAKLSNILGTSYFQKYAFPVEGMLIETKRS